MTTDELAQTFIDMGFDAVAMVSMVIVSLDRRLYAYEVELAMERAELPDFKVIQAINAVVVVVNEELA